MIMFREFADKSSFPSHTYFVVLIAFPRFFRAGLLKRDGLPPACRFQDGYGHIPKFCAGAGPLKSTRSTFVHNLVFLRGAAPPTPKAGAQCGSDLPVFIRVAGILVVSRAELPEPVAG